MYKSEFTKKLANHLNINQELSARLVNGFLELLIQEVKIDDPIRFLGFGTFKLKKRAGYTGISPANGKPIEIKPSVRFSFKPSPTLAHRKTLQDKA